ncbi:MAG: signal peptidase II [Clostridia bacterium]|nr:signal peptidase II [Clostridia bacterium]
MLKGKLKIQFSYKSLIFIVMLAILIFLDLLTKTLAERYDWQFGIKGLIVVDGVIHNTGMAFSFLADKSWGQAFLIAFSAVMIVVIIVLLLFIPERFTLLKLCLYMILSGAIGNLVDRIAFGYVRDFIWMSITNATCNFADVYIVVGTFLAIIDLLFLNEWAAFPLTKKAKAVQAERRKEEEQAKALKNAESQKQAESQNDDVKPEDEQSEKVE